MAWRLTAVIAALGLLVAAQLIDTDDYFPLGSLSQYGAPKDLDGTVLADLVGPGSQQVIARGGRGGLGNKALASPRRKARNRARMPPASVGTAVMPTPSRATFRI